MTSTIAKVVRKTYLCTQSQYYFRNTISDLQESKECTETSEYKTYRTKVMYLKKEGKLFRTFSPSNNENKN